MRSTPARIVCCASLRLTALLLAFVFAGIIGVSSRSVTVIADDFSVKSSEHIDQWAWQSADVDAMGGPVGTNSAKPEEKEEESRHEDTHEHKWTNLNEPTDWTNAQEAHAARAIFKAENTVERSPKVPLYLLFGTRSGFVDLI